VSGQLEDRILDLGLTELTTNVSHIYVCAAPTEPTTYALATGASARGAPTDDTGTRKITLPILPILFSD
jgi:hypothetical protein